jgi:hypothetical protein
MQYCEIDLNHFLKLKFPSRICQKKALILDPDFYWEHRGQFNHTFKLKTVEEVVQYYQNSNNLNIQKQKSKENNWEYFNCLLYGFRKNTLDTDKHKKLGGSEISSEERNKILTPEYYQSLEQMTDSEILEFNQKNPIDFDLEFIRHGTHRAYAMIGRLVRGEKYIPFYVKSDDFNPLLKLNFLQELDSLQIPKSEYTLCQSSILALMGIRSNDDLDIVVSSKLREYSLNGETNGCKIHKNIEVFCKNHGKFKAFGCEDDDDLIQNYSINLMGYNFVEPRFYFSRIWPENQRKVEDQNQIRMFMSSSKNNLYPFNQISKEKWGVELLPIKK